MPASLAKDGLQPRYCDRVSFQKMRTGAVSMIALSKLRDSASAYSSCFSLVISVDMPHIPIISP